MHLAHKLFSETNETKIPAIRQALETTVTQSKPFSLILANTGIFGSPYDPKVVWFGIDQNAELENLARNIFSEIAKCGWEPDRQNFVLHLTIGRIRELKAKLLFQQIISKYNTVKIQEENVSKNILYESILRWEGPEYIAKGVFRL